MLCGRGADECWVNRLCADYLHHLTPTCAQQDPLDAHWLKTLSSNRQSRSSTAPIKIIRGATIPMPPFPAALPRSTSAWHGVGVARACVTGGAIPRQPYEIWLIRQRKLRKRLVIN